MRARRPYILFVRPVIALLIATTCVGAWAGPELGDSVACSGCSAEDGAPVVVTDPAHTCCGDQPAGAERLPAQDADEFPPDDCCPEDCGRCCRTPARVPVVSAEADAVVPPTTVLTLPSTPPTL